MSRARALSLRSRNSEAEGELGLRLPLCVEPVGQGQVSRFGKQGVSLGIVADGKGGSENVGRTQWSQVFPQQGPCDCWEGGWNLRSMQPPSHLTVFLQEVRKMGRHGPW